MPARVHIPQRIIPHIAVPVQALRVARGGDDGVGLGEAGESEGARRRRGEWAALAGLCGWQGAGSGMGNRVDGAILAGGRAGRKGSGERADATVRSRARA